VVQSFFLEQARGLEIDWINTREELFREVNAKRMLFEARRQRSEDGYDALVTRLYDAGIGISREDVAAAMDPAEIHEDIKACFRRVMQRAA
jgi:hypothetical protein